MSKVTVSVVLTTVGYTSRFNGNGRPPTRYSPCVPTKVTRPVRPYKGQLVLMDYKWQLVLMDYKGILMRHETAVSCCIRIIYEFQKQFPSWNFLVPTEELFGSNGGTF